MIIDVLNVKQILINVSKCCLNFFQMVSQLLI